MVEERRAGGVCVCVGGGGRQRKRGGEIEAEFLSYNGYLVKGRERKTRGTGVEWWGWWSVDGKRGGRERVRGS